MINLHQHPDGLVFVRSSIATYQDTILNFQQDLGSFSTEQYRPAEFELYYEPNMRYFIDNVPYPAVWQFGDEIIASTMLLLEAQGTRTMPPAITKTDAIAIINLSAGEQRSRYATNIPFQGDLYQLKEREALLFTSDSYPDVDKYPILYAESVARSLQPATVAEEYLTNATLFPRILAAIEGVRMGAITAIKNAATIAEIEAALVAVQWPEIS